MAKHTNNKINKFGSQRHNVRRKVVAMRNKGATWAEIGEAIESAPRTARRMFDEAVGSDTHYLSFPERGRPFGLATYERLVDKGLVEVGEGS